MKIKLTRQFIRRVTGTALAVALALKPPMPANAEDIDLFVNAATSTATNPNILILLDNSANWNSNAQHWPTPSGETGIFKQGQSELRAIKKILGELDGANPKVNLGLMMFHSGSPDGGFLRYAIRPMDQTNIDGFVELIGAPSGCSGTNSLNGTNNCILQNFSGTGVEQTNSASTTYSGALFDAYKYFGGWTSPAYANVDNTLQVTTPKSSTAFGQQRYMGGAAFSRMDLAAYSADTLSYKASPIASPCAKNYIVFIGNGFPSQDTGGTLIQNVNAGASPLLPAQLSVPNFTTIVSTVVDNLGTYAPCTTAAVCAADAAANFAGLYDSFSCTGGTTIGTTTTLGTDAFCETNSACATRASGFGGFSSYSCTGGNTTTATVTNKGADSKCETAAACATTAQGLFPGHTSWQCTGGTNPSGVTLGLDATCESNANCVSRALATFGTAYNSYACSGGVGCGGSKLVGQTYLGSCTAASKKNQTMQTVDGTTCASPNLVSQTMQGTNTCLSNQTQQGIKAVSTVTPLTTFTAPSSVNYADEWARFLYTTDVVDLAGQQSVTTFTIDVFKDHQDPNETALLFNMAKYGGGKYFQATNEDAIVNALRQIMIEIQSVNTVFASASLPINSTNRSQNENQVFIGMFRPDGSANPRWYGNLKRYQVGIFGGVVGLADNSSPPVEAVSSQTGFVQPCAKSFWTVDSGTYWLFQNGSAGQCTSSGTSLFSDSPDGPLVEKGAVAEVLRRGNNPPTTAGVQSPLPSVSRTMYTCVDSSSCCESPATCVGTTAAQKAVELVTFNTTNVSKTQLGSAAMTDLERDNIIAYTRGQDIFDQNTNATAADVRPSIHGDVAHSRPLPVNYGSTTGVVLYYGANDGTFRAVKGNDGSEAWSFIAPEHHARLKRLTDNSPPILYPNQDPVPAGAIGKDYFFDGSAGLFQNANNTKIWIYPSMRRGGRMLYSFDVTSASTPVLKWRVGCSNPSMGDTASCTTGLGQMGQTWSIPAVALVKGFSTSVNSPVLIVGGGYDTCEDQDAAPNTSCDPTTQKGNAVYVFNADTGALLKTFTTRGSVAADVTLVDRDFDGFADHAYVATTSGSIYRIDFVDPANVATFRVPADWTINEVARTSGANRKFLFSPAVLPATGKMYISMATGDRERPLIVNYPFTTPVTNRAYMLVDKFEVTTNPTTSAVTGTAVDLDSTSMANFTTTTSCSDSSAEALGKKGWFFDLNSATGEQGVTSTSIFGGIVFFSTNHPVPTPPGACAQDLGEARGYAVDVLNASGAVGVAGICGGTRSGIFTGGGLPPSPVTGTVPVDGKQTTVCIGCIDRTTGVGSPINPGQIKPTITQKRSRIYWYKKGDQ